MGAVQMAGTKSAIRITTGAALRGPSRRRGEPDHMLVAASAPETSLRRLEALLAQCGTSELGTQVRLMKLRGQLTESQCNACDWFAELYAKYLQAIDAKGIKSGSAELVSKSTPPDPFSDEGSRKAKREREDVQRYESARLAGLACGSERFAMFCNIVIRDETPSWADRVAVSSVSEALSNYRRLASSRRRALRRD